MALLEGSRYQKIAEGAVSFMLWYKFSPMFNMRLNKTVHKDAVKYTREGYTKRQAAFLAWDKHDFYKKYKNYILSQPAAKHTLKDLWELSLRKDVFIKCSCSGYPCRRHVIIDIMHELFNDGTIPKQQTPRPQDQKEAVEIENPQIENMRQMRNILKDLGIKTYE